MVVAGTCLRRWWCGCGRRPQLEEAAVLLKFNKDQADALAWLAGKRSALAAAETAADLASAQKLLRKHGELKVRIAGGGDAPSWLANRGPRFAAPSRGCARTG